MTEPLWIWYKVENQPSQTVFVEKAFYFQAEENFNPSAHILIFEAKSNEHPAFISLCLIAPKKGS